MIQRHQTARKNFYKIGPWWTCVDWKCWAVGVYCVADYGTAYVFGPLSIASRTEILPVRPMNTSPSEETIVAQVNNSHAIIASIHKGSFLFGIIVAAYGMGLYWHASWVQRTYFCFAPGTFSTRRIIDINQRTRILFPVRFWMRKFLSNFR